MKRISGMTGLAALLAVGLSACGGGGGSTPLPTDPEGGGPVFTPREVPADVSITAADCSAAKIGSAIDTALIGEPLGSITLAAPSWVAAAGATPAHCRVTGTMFPVDVAASTIQFAVVLPENWKHRAAQQGGGGMNGSVPGLNSYLQRGWAAYGSDSGHQGANMTWALVDEAVQNFGYMQLKKTHDAAWVLIERMYGSKPVYSYFFGNSQGGREALTAAQRYPQDYDGIYATVPVLSFSTLTLSRALQRIQEIRLENWVPPQKAIAIATEFIRQCDKLDGLADGIMNSYKACRDQFDARKNPRAWEYKRCPGGLVDPNPTDTTASACLTDGQIETLKFTYTPYQFATPLAYGTTHFGMYAPTTSPGAEGTLRPTRVQGQEGADAGAAVFSWTGGQLVMPALWRDANANPLSYVEGGLLNERRRVLSEWVDSTNPDLSGYYEKGGKLIVGVGTADMLAPNGAQLDYYEALHETMGKETLDRFARLYVYPHMGHGLSGTNYGVDGDGRTIPTMAIPNSYDQIGALTRWVETNETPGLTVDLTTGARSMPLCSYPKHPHYKGEGLPTDQSTSYECRD